MLGSLAGRSMVVGEQRCHSHNTVISLRTTTSRIIEIDLSMFDAVNCGCKTVKLLQVPSILLVDNAQTLEQRSQVVDRRWMMSLGELSLCVTCKHHKISM